MSPASMRPPQKTGENRNQAVEPGCVRGASMRPPQKTGENVQPQHLHVLPQQASMRPPQKTGENGRRRWRHEQGQAASMRPPQKTGENSPGGYVFDGRAMCFNEAPAEDGGKHAGPRDARIQPTQLQ